MAKAVAARAPARKSSLVDDAYGKLKAAIRENVFAPGYQGSELEMALRLGMSRTPVHEAIIRLQEEGMVRVLAKRGVVVLPLSPEDMREIYEVTAPLEAAAAELVAKLAAAARKPVVEQLTRLNADMQKALKRDDLDAWVRIDEQFHRAIFEACGNGRIARFAQTMLDQVHRARAMTVRLRAKPVRSLKEHRLIVDAIRRGDGLAAHRQMHDHRVRAGRELLPLLASLGVRHF
jgi:DNA-binding GntR family transcriptional regulator